jgi:protein gp37
VRIPAPVRFVIYEPALTHVDWSKWVQHDNYCYLDCSKGSDALHSCPRGRIDWLIVGGESGPGARFFDLQWARSAVQQCKAAGVPVFVNQLGAQPVETPAQLLRHLCGASAAKAVGTLPGSCKTMLTPSLVDLRDRKGGDMAEWPEDLRVREFPYV